MEFDKCWRENCPGHAPARCLTERKLHAVECPRPVERPRPRVGQTIGQFLDVRPKEVAA
jgi:hypothetical protein